MPDNTSHIVLPQIGIVSDNNLLSLDSKHYSFALNTVISDKTGEESSLQNEMSNICAVVFPPGYRVVGFKEIPEQNRTLYMLVNPANGNSQIGEVHNCIHTFERTDRIEKVYCKDCPDNYSTELTPLEKREEQCYCSYRMIISEPCLGFDINYPIDIEYRITSCSLNIYFVDAKNERRFIYFDYEDNDINGNLILQNNFKITTPTLTGCMCPTGYTLNNDNTLCIKRTITPIVPSGVTRTACDYNSAVYTSQGIALYSTFSSNGTGTSTLHHTTDTYWSNPSGNTIDGVLNRTGLWACDAFGVPQVSSDYLPLNEDIGFVFPVNLTTSKTYYIGIAGDNTVKVLLDCNVVIDMDATAIGTQYGFGPSSTFKFWHIYPVVIPAGRHIIQLTGKNTGGIAGFGAEIYDNTAAEIIASTAGVGLNILYSTANMIGQPLQVSSSFSGTCASGTCVDIDNLGNLFCVDVDTIAPNCDPCLTEIITEQLDCDKIKVHPDYDRVCTEFIDFVNGGQLKAGTYQIIVAYADAYGNTISSYFPSTQIAPLFQKQITLETNYSTGSALHFKINNLKTDLLYNYYNIVIAETIDSFTQFKYIGTFPTSQKEYTYTGFETSIKVLDPQEVFAKYPYYKTAKSVTKANNYLFYSGVKSYKKLNLQPVANAIVLNWQTVALKEGAYKDPRNTFLFRSEQRDEVVPYGVVFEFNNGEETCVFHIPGRASIPSDLTPIATGNADYIVDHNCTVPAPKPKWQIYNTATIEGTPHEYNQDCEYNKCWEYGKFSYWESTETYPKIREVWGDLCGQPIRHHKFPDSCISHIHDGINATKTFNENNYIFPIGVQVDHQSVINSIAAAVTANIITQEDADRIVSYRIVRGNRLGNKSVIAKGLFYNMWFYDKFSKRYYYPNYAYNDLRQDYFLAPSNNFGGSNTSSPDPVQPDHIDFSRFTFHSPDTHFVQPQLGTFVKIETEEYGQSEGYFTFSDCQAKHKLLSTASRVLAFGLGVAAAFSATGDKQCKAVTTKSERHIDGYIAGTNPGATVTIPTPIPFAVQGDLAVSPGALDALTYQADTGLPIIPHPLASEATFQSCRGEAFQIFNTNLLINGALLLIGTTGLIVQRVMLGIIEMNKVIDTMLQLVPYRNYSVQYNSVGKYNNYKCVSPNNKNREILRSAYLEPIIQNIDEVSTVPNATSTTIRVNNWNRESSVYLKLGGTNLVAPTVVDDSRVTIDNQFGAQYPNDGDRYANSLDQIFNKTISAYYGTIKRNIPNQYGDLCTIQYLEASTCSFFLNKTYTTCEAKIFGGDTYINRFSIKRKMPFWLQTRCGLPNGSDVKYSTLSNVAYPNYYFNTEEPLTEKLESLGGGLGTILQDLIGTADSRMDAKTSKFFYQNGYVHMYNYGVPSFIVESDINLDYRHGQNRPEEDFYPHQTDLKYWFEEANVPIKEDNKYFYNRTYSKQNKETEECTSCIKTLRDLACNTHDDNLVIYSDPNEQDRKNDNWLVFRANNFYNFPLTDGKLISIDGIENDKILIRLENTFKIFNAYNTIQATPENIQVGTGSIFATRPQEFAVTDLGDAGTQHRDILHTPFGHIWGDAKRGQIINLGNGGNGLDEISRYGVKNWFKENLPFRLKQDFPNIPDEDIDNNLKGVGLHFCFDKRYNRILVTKLDYKVLDRSVKYNPTTHIFYILVDSQPVEVKLNNTKYFCNRSWTRSYNFATKGWTSFHSYLPNFYIEHIDGFESSAINYINVNNTLTEQQRTLYHNVTNKSYQVFNGKLYPFIIEVIGQQSINNNFLDSFQYSLDVIRYHNEYDAFYNNKKGFNKAIVYNERQCSGMLNLIYNDHNDLSMLGEYPKLTDKGIEILSTNTENNWNFNGFSDIVSSEYNNLTFFNYDCANVNKVLNTKALDYLRTELDNGRIRQRQCKVRLINDIHSNYKMIFNFGIVGQTKSYR